MRSGVDVDADEIIGRLDHAREAIAVLPTATAGRSSVLALVGARDYGASRFARWLVAHRAPHVELFWLTGATMTIAELRALDTRVRTMTATTMIIVVDDIAASPDDERSQVGELVTSVDDAAGSTTLLVLVAAAEDELPPTMAQATSVVRICFGPLEDDALFELMCRILGGPVDLAFADAVGQLCGGAPEAVRRLLERAAAEGSLDRSPTGWRPRRSLAAFASMAGPSVALERPLDTSSDLVETAACMGVEGRLEPLRTALGAEPTVFVRELSDAAEHRILDDDGERYWFLEPAVREAVHRAIPVRRRQARHAAIAAALADEPTVASTARDDQALLHWTMAGAHADPHRRTLAVRAIAGRAEVAKRWRAAARALDVLLTDPDLEPSERIRLLERAGEAHFQHQSVHRAIDFYDEVAHLAATFGDPVAGRAATVRAMSIRVALGLPIDHVDCKEEDDELMAWALSARADAHFAAGDVISGLDACARADTHARRASLPEVSVRAAMSEGHHHLLSLDTERARQAYERARLRARDSHDALHRIWPESRLALAEWIAGHDDEARRLASAAAIESERHRWWGEAALAHSVHSVALLSCGLLEDAERTARRSVALSRRAAYAFGLPLALPVLAATGVLSGRADRFDESVATWSSHARVPSAVTALGNVMLGGHAAMSDLPRKLPRSDLFRSGASVVAADLGDWTENSDLAAMALPVLTELVERGIVNVPGWLTSVTRAAAVAARGAGLASLAADLARQAAREADTSGAGLAGALARYDLARWGVDGAGIGALVGSITEMERLGLTAFVGRAQAQVDRHPEVQHVLADHPMRVLLYTDLVGSTAVNVRAGDRRFVELLAAHQASVDASIAAHRGVRFHNTGDGFGIWFTHVRDAVDCAVDIRRRLRAVPVDDSDGGLIVRIGLAAGRPIPFDGDLYGVAVVRAARVCARAAAAEILLSQEVLEMDRLSGRRVTFLEEALLKGFEHPTMLYRLD